MDFFLNPLKFANQDDLCLMPIRNFPYLSYLVHWNCMRGGFVNESDTITSGTLSVNSLQSICPDFESELPSPNDTHQKLLHRIRKHKRQWVVRHTRILEKPAKHSSRFCSEEHEKEKKRKYNRRVIEVEQNSFTPLVFTTSGVMSRGCSLFHKAVTEKISQKKNEQYGTIMSTCESYFRFLCC